MNAAQLLVDLGKLGVRVRPEGDQLMLASEEAIDDALISKIRDCKPELLDLLDSRCSRCRNLEAQGVVTLICSTCGYGFQTERGQGGRQEIDQ